MFHVITVMCVATFMRESVADRVPVINCQTGTTALKAEARLTCYYPWDLNYTQSSFSVFQCGPKYKEVVLGCNWWRGQLICKAKEGFHPPDSVSNHFTVTIEKDEDGEYYCDIFPSENSTDVRKCHFHQEAEIQSHSPDHAVSDEFTVEVPIQKGTGELSCDTIPPDISVTVEKCTLSSTDSGVDENVSTNTTVNPIPRAARPAQDSDKCGCVTSKGLLAASVVLSTTIVVLSILLVALYVHYKRRFRSFHWRSMDKECAVDLTEKSPCGHCAATNNSSPKQENQSNGHINSRLV